MWGFENVSQTSAASDTCNSTQLLYHINVNQYKSSIQYGVGSFSL